MDIDIMIINEEYDEKLNLTSDLTKNILDDNLIDDLLCRNKIKPKNVEQILYTSDFALYHMDDNKLLGIICIRYIEENEWEISLICAVTNNVGLGSKLLSKVIQLCEINNIKKLFGFALYEDSSKLFKKFGFNEYDELIFKGGHKNNRRKKSKRKKIILNKTRRKK